MAFIFKPFTPVPMLKKLEYMGCEYYLKKTEGITYIGYGGNVYAHSTNPAFNKGLFLFGMVKKDFENWISKNPSPKFEESYRPVFENRSPLVKRDEKEYSYDINHAYWRVSFLSGYISENTYKHGLALKAKDEQMKQLYCMAMSVQGQEKKLVSFKGDKLTGKHLSLRKNQKMKDMYTDVRNKTYKIMDDLAYQLKGDFISYNIDCITFYKEKNCKIVEDYLTSKKLTFKTK